MLRDRVNGRFVGVQLRFWMQGFIVIAIFMGVGLHALTTTLQLPSVLALLAACLLVLLQLGVNYASVIPITRDNSYLLQYGRAQLEPLPDSSLYIVQGDLQENSILYLQQCLHDREDIDVIYLPYASYMWYNHSQLSLYPKVHWPGVVYHPLGSILHDHTGNAFNLTYTTVASFFLGSSWTPTSTIGESLRRRGCICR